MSRRPPNLVLPTAPTTPHSLAILSEYTHTLDSLPLDLSRNFADLRELDAVLSSSMAVLTQKITRLTTMIENNTAPKDQRLWLLSEIAEEAHRLKLGGEDKIRVACHAADGLRGHKTHMRMLLQHVPDPDYDALADRLARKTVFPHVSTRTYFPTGMTEGGRRQRRGAAGGFLTSAAVDAAPNAKRKRAAGREDDLDVIKSPRKERTGDAPRQRNNARAKRVERPASPTESVLSVASHLQATHLAAQQSSNSRQNGHAHAPSTASNSKRSRAPRATPDALSANLDAVASRKELYNAPPSSSTSHPSLPLPYGHSAAGGNGINGAHVSSGASEWAHGQLEGPGMPVARIYTPVAMDTPDAGAGTGAEVDADPDDGRTYCFCDGISYGDMIACDDLSCEREWFHLPCIGLTVPPDGTWYCDTCLAKRNKQRGGRGGKKRTGGGRAGARNTS